MRENVSNAINVLSGVNISDNFNKAISSLNSNYIVNGITCKNNDLKNIQQSVRNDLNSLRVILSSVNAKIKNLNDEIEDAEMAERM